MSTASTRLDLRLLGPFALNGPIRLPTRKAEALLAYLAVSAGRPQRRDTLMGLLWGERGEKQARHSLSQTLFSLRKALAETESGEAALVIDGDTVWLDPDHATIDVTAFEYLAAERTPDSLAAAAALYRGELLQGLSVREIAFEDWLAGERSRLRELAVTVLGELTEHYERERALTPAVQSAVRLLAIDPLQEKAHRALMRLYSAQGRPTAALKQYDRCAELLRRELGVEPETETRQLRTTIMQRRQLRPEHGQDHAAPPPEAPERPPESVPESPPLSPAPPLPHRPRPPRAAPIGRDDELRRLETWFSEACDGHRKVVFVSGEAGIGKTTLVDAFAARIAAGEGAIPIGRGQCIEHRGAGEPYMPVLAALSNLCRTSRDFLSCLEVYAPTWLTQLPGVASLLPNRPLLPPVGATQERMLREMVEVLEVATTTAPVVLILEDLHWSDHSTVDLLEALVHRREPARLLIIATYRQGDPATSSSLVQGLARTLCIRGLCEELEVSALGETAVERYLANRFPGGPPPQGLANLLSRRAGGNPLFMVNLLEWWLSQGSLSRDDEGLKAETNLTALEVGVPENLRFLIEQHLDRLPDEERRVLETASVAGVEFAAASVAAGLGVTEDEAEMCLASLARRGLFIQACGTAEWPDGTIGSSFSFLHQLYRESLYQRLAAGQRVRLHRRIGERLEAVHAADPTVLTTELALHFLQARDAPRAVLYLEKAAHQALRRTAHREAVGHLKEALALVPSLKEGDRAQWELRLQIALGPALVATHGWSAPEVERAFTRAFDLGQAVGDPRTLSSAMFGLATLLEFRGEYKRTEAILDQRLSLLKREPEPNPSALVESNELMACSTFHQGKFDKAVAHASRALAAYDSARDLALTASLGDNPAIACRGWAARALWFLGRPDEAIEHANEALTLARSEGYSFALALAHEVVGRTHQHRREPEAVLDHAIRAAALGEEYGFPYRAAAGAILRGWARAMLGDPEAGIVDIERGLESCRAIGAALDYPYFLALLGEAHYRAGQAAEGSRVLKEALSLSRRSRGFFYEAEIVRLMGCLELLRDPCDEKGVAEEIFRNALTIGRNQNAHGLEFRCGVTLADLYLRQGRTEEARGMIGAVDGQVIGGEQTRDAREAKDLLEQLALRGAPRRPRRGVSMSPDS